MSKNISKFRKYEYQEKGLSKKKKGKHQSVEKIKRDAEIDLEDYQK